MCWIPRAKLSGSKANWRCSRSHSQKRGRHGKRVRFFSTVDLIDALEQEMTHNRAGRLATSLLRLDWLSSMRLSW